MTFAKLVGHPAKVGKPGEIHTTQVNALGLEAKDGDGNTWKYLQGIAAVAEGVWVTYSAAYVAKILTANDVGPVAVASAAILASQFGWFMVDGDYTTASSDTVAAANGLFIDATPGRVDDDSVAGDFVNGAIARGADATNVLAVHLSRPYVTNTVPA
jgi:hypothetical protein